MEKDEAYCEGCNSRDCSFKGDFIVTTQCTLGWGECSRCNTLYCASCCKSRMVKYIPELERKLNISAYLGEGASLLVEGVSDDTIGICGPETGVQAIDCGTCGDITVMSFHNYDKQCFRCMKMFLPDYIAGIGSCVHHVGDHELPVANIHGEEKGNRDDGH